MKNFPSIPDPMKRRIILWTVLSLLGLLGGALGKHYFVQTEQEQTAEAPIQEQQELSTDSFSVRFFQQALSEKPSGNILVAPHLVSDMLLVLQECSAGKTREELQSLELRRTQTLRATEPTCAMLLGMDFNLPRQNSRRGVMPLPFSENLPMALSLFNGSLSQAIGNTNIQLANSQMVTSRTKLLLGGTLNLRKEWEIPFSSTHSRTAGFDNASGSMPHIHQLRNRGMYRVTEASDKSWKAVAIPFRNDTAGGSQLVYIAILPDGNAREFALQLTPERLTTIRRELAQASPQDTLVEIPRQELQILPYDMRDTLRRMGLKALFDPETADFSPLTTDKIQLGAALFSASVYLTESGTSTQSDSSLDYAERVFSLARPYIWMITDLETDLPLEFIALIEEL